MMVSLTNNQRHDAYWKQRMDDILRYVDEVDIELFAELTELYGEFSRRVQKEVFAFYSKYAQENELTLQEAKKKLRGMDLSDYQANARRYLEDTRDNPELWRRLNEQYQSSRGLRLDALELELDYRIGQLNEQVTRRFDQYVRQVAGYAYQKIVNDISRVPINQPALEQVIMRPWNGYNYSEAVWGNTHHLAEHLKKVFKNGFIRGLSAREIASDVRKQFDVAKHRAETLVRTEGTHIVNSATTQRYREFGLKYYQLHIHLDNRTSAICKRLAKVDKTYALDEAEPGVTAPPFHYNCRTTMIPSEEELNEEHWVEDDDHQVFKTKDDPMREYFGSMFDSHPEETKKLIDELKDMGVEINFKNRDVMNYGPSPRIGQPGQLNIYEKASYSALLHEYTHVKDDEKMGWQGMANLMDTKIAVSFEKHAYDAEIKLAKLHNAPKSYIMRLEELKEESINYLRNR